MELSCCMVTTLLAELALELPSDSVCLDISMGCPHDAKYFFWNLLLSHIHMGDLNQ